jgi:hypothetical protein
MQMINSAKTQHIVFFVRENFHIERFSPYIPHSPRPDVPEHVVVELKLHNRLLIM